MPATMFFSLRYLQSCKKNMFLSLIAVLATVGVATGVCFLVVVMSVMAGFEKDLRDRILGFDAHLVLTGKNGIENPERLFPFLEKQAGVVAIAPYIEGEVLVAMSGGKTRGAIVRGIDPIRAGRVLDLPKSLQGSCRDMELADCLRQEKSDDLPRTVVGAELARGLRAYLDPRQRLKLISPLGSLGPFGFEPRVREFHMVDTFNSGFYEHDSNYLYIPISEARSFFSSGARVTGIGIRVTDIEATPALKKRIEANLPKGEGLEVQDWQDRNRKLFDALQLEKWVMAVVLSLIVLVASFVIFVTLSMLVLEKRPGIAVLRSSGATQRDITKIFLLDGAFIGCFGAVCGLVLGLTLCYVLDRYQFVRLPSQYYVTTIPVVYEWGNIAAVFIGAILLSLIATAYPARQAALANPIEILRYE